MRIEEMISRKKELGYSYGKIAELSGIPAATVQKVLSGVTKAPRYETLRALENVLREKESSPDTSSGCHPAAESSGEKGLYSQIRVIPAGHVSETANKYLPGKKQGDFTIEDYLSLPDDQRVELIDGVIYDMSSPLSVHQLLVGYIHADLFGYIQKNEGNCLPLISPFDVQLDCDDKTMVEPDLMILCDRDKLNRHRVFGAPDFVIEILSPSTRLKDMTIKLRKYMLAGVREYWIIWPEKQKIAVYRFDDDSDACPTLYGFQDQVPVGIWGGAHQVDMASIYEQIAFIYDRE